MPASSKSVIDSKLIRELAKILRETELSEIEIERGDMKLRVVRNLTAGAQIMHAAAPAPVSDPAAAPVAAETPAVSAAAEGAIPSPMVGTAYLRPDPEADAFKSEGDEVKEGETVLLIEAMKTFNPIAAPRSGKLTKLLVTDGQPVEFGEPLFIIA